MRFAHTLEVPVALWSARRGRHGFTLLELMIVVSLIAIIVSIALPNIMRSRMNANESSAIGSMRTIATGQFGFKAAGFVDANNNGDSDYGTLVQLADPTGDGSTPGFIDEVLASGAKLGYSYQMNVTLGGSDTAATFECVAAPLASGRSGYQQFFVDDSGVIRFTADGNTPTVNSLPVN
jgi:type IV pilus assembly protein PilA